MKEVICPCCEKPAELVDSKVIYGRSYGRAYLCRCDPDLVYVGCHKGTDIPLGTMANKELREARKRTHRVFDSVWKTKRKSRTRAYAWLSEGLGIRPERCHIAMFDKIQCQQVMDLCRGV